MNLIGGGGKKKNYTKPKRIKHKHKKRKMPSLSYYNVENDKVVKLKLECPECNSNMAEHKNRHNCGKCGKMFYKN